MISRIHDALSVPFGAASGWSWGLSIVILVMLMRLVMVPLFVKQVKSQRKMQSHMPALQEIRKRYKNDKTRLNEETMKFYKENGINPLGGCLPLVAQLPVFWSLFNVLKAIADWMPGQCPVRAVGGDRHERAQAHIFGVLLSDKFLWATTGESWTVRAVILASVAVSATTTFLTMRQSSKRGMMNQQMPDPDQPGAAMAQSMSKNMMYIAPFFALTGLYWQYGLVIYWVTTNCGRWGSSTSCSATFPSWGARRWRRDARIDTAGRPDRTAVQDQPGGGRRQEQRFRQDGAARPARPPRPAPRASQARRASRRRRRTAATAKATASKPTTGTSAAKPPQRSRPRRRGGPRRAGQTDLQRRLE